MFSGPRQATTKVNKIPLKMNEINKFPIEQLSVTVCLPCLKFLLHIRFQWGSYLDCILNR